MTKRLSFLLLFSSLTALAQPNFEVTTKDGSKKLLGEVSREKLTTEPYNSWFKKQYNDYAVQSDMLTPVRDKLKSSTIVIFMGTWCGDTKREVPRFLKLLDQLNFPPEQLRIICLDNDEQMYKQSPQHEEAGMAVHRVPTFIIRENNVETGRIVESPVVSLEQDLVNILNKNRPKVNYTAANNLLAWVENDRIKYIEEHLTDFAGEWRALISSSAELNTVGYVLMGRGKLNEAIPILRLNTLLFPSVANTYDSLAEAYMKNMNPELAIKNYTRVLELKPNDANALEKLKQLEK